MYRACVLTGYGINCDNETYTAFELAGFEPKKVHINDVIHKKESLEDYHVLAFPGGFSYGDDIASGKVYANKFRFNLKDEMTKFIADEKLSIGICNGFQAMVKMGLLPALDGEYFKQMVTLTFNDSGRFEDRWVYLEPNTKSPCVFTQGMNRVYNPVRHGEGKFYCDDETLAKLEEKHLVAFTYVDQDGGEADYPQNPNGSLHGIAALSDETGHLFGLMPHPEAYLFRTNHPRWTREEVPDVGMGRQIFENALEYCKRKF
jgi:phosphoribosylformylglycinamidine synthase I